MEVHLEADTTPVAPLLLTWRPAPLLLTWLPNPADDIVADVAAGVDADATADSAADMETNLSIKAPAKGMLFPLQVATTADVMHDRIHYIGAPSDLP